MTNPNAVRLFQQLQSMPFIPDDRACMELFDACDPVDPKDIISRWHGHDFNTGRMGSQSLRAMRWYGKWFTSTERGGALPLICWDNKGCLYSNEAMGNATLIVDEFRGVRSAAMAYDSQPVVDQFRKLDDAATILIGIMTGQMGNGMPVTENGHYFYFYLERIAEWPAPFDPNEH